MLVLSRKEKERILIGEEIILTVVQLAGNKVRIGIEAPEAVIIRREELLTQWQDDRPRRSRWSVYRTAHGPTAPGSTGNP